MNQERFKAVKIIMQRAQINNCPVAAVRTTIYKDTVSGKKVFANEFRNQGDKKVCSLSVRISCFDEQVKLLGTIKDYKYNDINAASGEEFGQNKYIACPDEAINSFAVAVTHVELEEDYFWDESVKEIQSHVKEAAIEVEMAPEVPEEPVDISEPQVMPETLDEELFSYSIKNPEEKISVTAMIENEGIPDNNDIREENIETVKAENEGTAQEPEEKEISDEINEEIKETKETNEGEIREEIKEENVKEKETEEEKNTAAVESGGVNSENSETVPEDSDTGTNKKKKSKKEKKIKEKKVKEKKPMPKALKILIALFIIAVLAAAAFLALDKYIKYSDYNRGAAFMANGDYEYAINVYAKLGSYMDAPVLLEEAKKAYADSLYNAGEYEKAIEEYGKISGQEGKITECYNAWALSLCSEGRYDEALKLVQNAENAVDSEVLNEIRYEIGVKLFEEKSYKEAIDYFVQIDGYKDSKELINKSYYQLGTEMLGVGNYEQALDAFAQIKNYKDVPDQIKNANYLQGKRFMESMAYEDAVKCFEEITEYEDSAELIKECYYFQGDAFMNSQNYEKAMEYFKNAADYEDAQDKYYEALYSCLIVQMKTEVTLETMDKLSELPKNYKDTNEIIKTLKKYVDHVGEYKWTTSNDKEINSQGGFEDPVIVSLTYEDGTAHLTVDGNPVDLKLFVYKSGTESNTYTMLNTTTITRTFNGKIHTYKKVIEK